MTVSRRDDMDVAFLDDVPEASQVQQANPMVELGVTGLKRTGGYIDEEFLPALRGRKAIQVFREMSLNDSIVGALLFAIDKLIREVEWKVVPAQQNADGQKAADFLESCMDDMSHSWGDFITEVLTMIPFGWSWHECVYKKRMGPWQRDPKKKSKYTDGMIGWRKMPIRAQETWMRWIFDENGGIRAMVQMAPPHYKTTVIPIEKSLLFRVNATKGNPEGQSLLRTAYRSWYFKKRLEEFEAIGVERDLAGMPVARVPADYLNAPKGSKQDKMVQSFRKMVRGVRRDENEGLVLPTQYDQETKQPLFDFELMSSGGSRQFDTTGIIQRYEQRILMSVLADFILVGHQDTGSYALHTDKTGIFRASLNAITKAIADTLNRHAVPRLFEVNGWKPDELPRFEPTDIDPPDLNELASFITATAGAGMQWFPDPDLEKFLRDIARLPEMTEEQQDYQREMLMQQQAMEYAQSSMTLLGMKQKATLTAQGMSPEQAQMASEQPTSEMQQSAAAGEMDAEGVRMAHPVGQIQQQQAMEQQQMEMQGQQDSPADQANFQRDVARNQMQAQAADKQTQREKETQKLSETQALRAHSREKERSRLSDQQAERSHKREMARARLQEQIKERQHKRDMEKLRLQSRKPQNGNSSNNRKKDKR